MNPSLFLLTYFTREFALEFREDQYKSFLAYTSLFGQNDEDSNDGDDTSSGWGPSLTSLESNEEKSLEIESCDQSPKVKLDL